MPSLPFLALLLPLGSAGNHPDPAPAERRAGYFHCTPISVEASGGGPQRSDNPIADALDEARPGDLIYLDPGSYPAFTIGFKSNSRANAQTSGGQPGLPVTIEGAPGVQIVGSSGDTIAIDQAIPNGWITFRRLVIVPGRRSGVLFFRQGKGVHDGYVFEDCQIRGSFDPLTGKGRRTKWGLWGHRMSNFRFVGTSEPARVERISDEHAFYIQNPAGSILIENVVSRYLGRTFCQFTARETEGPPGIGDITVRRCQVSDACIADGDGFKGGSAFTVAGRLTGLLLFEENTYRAGFDRRFQKLTLPDSPYGTGAFTAWEDRPGSRNGTLILRNNDFRMAEGCGDRPLVAIGGTDTVRIVGQNRFHSGGKEPALALDPVTPRGRPISSPNADVFLAAQTQIVGPFTILGQEATEEKRRALERRGTPAKESGGGGR